MVVSEAGATMMALALLGALYWVGAAILIVWQWARPSANIPPLSAAVSILKPLKGAEPCLLEALESALDQDYTDASELICGVQDPADPAVQAVQQLKGRFPDRAVVLVQDSHSHGINGKISNLINMLSAARHDVLVIADGDIVAPRSWLSAVVTALQQPGVGVVSCFYAGDGRTAWGRLTAMGLSYQFLPNAIFGTAAGLAHPCFGSTIALRRSTLAAIGGFEAFRNTLADDYEIGRAVRARDYRLAYPPLLLRHICAEETFTELWRRELRWARTIRTVDPLGHFGSAVTHAFPLALLGAVLTGFSPGALIVLATVLAIRLFLKSRMDHIAGMRAGPAWLLPARDVLSFGVFLASLAGRRVAWRAQWLRIGEHGLIS